MEIATTTTTATKPSLQDPSFTMEREIFVCVACCQFIFTTIFKVNMTTVMKNKSKF